MAGFPRYCPTCGFEAVNKHQQDTHSEEQCSNILASHRKAKAGTVPASKQKGNSMATTQKSGVHYGDNYEEELQEWTDYLGEMQDAINDGYCDNILKELARAIFDRRDHLNGKPAGYSFRNGEDRTVPPIADPVPATSTIPTMAGTATHDPQGVFVGRLTPTSPQHGVAQFEVNGKTYNKKDLIGQVIRMPMTVNPSYVRALKVKVVGVGDKRVKVEWVDLPKPGSKYRDLADKGQPVFVPLSTLSDVLG